jgi:general bacterial porin, GBP family
MRKKVLAAATLLGSIAGAAHAQSSVTLYGLVDSAIGYTTNLGSTNGHINHGVQALPGAMSANRWGLLGTEDIGGGTHVVFRLENGFNIQNGTLGQGGRMFGRSAYVGIGNDSWGTVTAGRQYMPFQEDVGNEVAPYYMSGYTFHPYDNDDLNATFRPNNALKYTTPTIAGFTAKGLYAFSNLAGQINTNRLWSASADYVHGPFHADVGFFTVNQPGYSTAGAESSDNTYGALPSIAAGGIAKHTVWGAGAAYNFGSLLTEILYTHAAFDATVGGVLTFNNYEANVRYQLTPATVLTAAYLYTTQRSTVTAGDNTHYHQGAVGINYFLSKSCDIYSNLVYQRAAGSAHAWILNETSMSSNNSQFIALVGIRKKF